MGNKPTWGESLRGTGGMLRNVDQLRVSGAVTKTLVESLNRSN